MKLALLAMIVCLSCGPSSHEVALTKLARYHADKLVLLERARDVAETKYPETRTDETQLMIQTRPRWYHPNGMTIPVPSDNPDESVERIRVDDRSLLFALTVTLQPDGDDWIVEVHPVIARYNRGMPKLEPLTMHHADLPGWVSGKVDQLAYEIHGALQAYEVKGAR